MDRISVKGVAAAAGTIILIVAVVIVMMLGLELNDWGATSYINTSWVIGGSAALLAGAPIAAYFSARKRMPASTPMEVTRAAAMQILRALLLVIGILGLLFVLSSQVH